MHKAVLALKGQSTGALGLHTGHCTVVWQVLDTSAGSTGEAPDSALGILEGFLEGVTEVQVRPEA